MLERMERGSFMAFLFLSLAAVAPDACGAGSGGGRTLPEGRMGEGERPEVIAIGFMLSSPLDSKGLEVVEAIPSDEKELTGGGWYPPVLAGTTADAPPLLLLTP